MTSAQATFSISAGAATTLVYATSPQTLPAGSVSSIITVQRQDVHNNPVISGTIDLDLTTTSTTGKFYSDASGTTQITTVSIADTSSVASFYYMDTNAGTPTLTAASAGLTSATAVFTINSASASMLSFYVGAGQTVAANTPSTAIRVQLQDAYGNPVLSTGISINLATTSTTGKFYSDAGCTMQINPAVVAIAAASNHTLSFYYKDTTAGTPTITAHSGALTDGTTQLTISAGAATKLVYTAGTTQSLATGAISSIITIQRQDVNSNPAITGAITVNLATSAPTTGTFYSDASGTTIITTATITDGSSSASFYYKDTKIGTPTLTSSYTGLTSATTTFTISAGATTKLVYTAGTTQTVAAGSVSAIVTVQRQDASGNPTTTGAITVNLATSASSTGKFYSDAGGTTQITTVSIVAGASSASFYYKDTAAGSPTLTSSYTGLTSATTTFTISAGATTKLVYTAGTTQTVAAGSVSAIVTVQRQDASGNPTTTGAITVNLATSASSTGKFYSDAGGTTQITTVSIVAGASSASFYYKDTAAGSPTLTSSYTGLTSATTTFTISAGALSKFAFTTIGSQTVNVAFSITITAQDAYGNTVTSYIGTPTITYSAGTISPTNIGAFASGTKTGSVTVTIAGSSVTITATDGTTTGTSNTFTVSSGTGIFGYQTQGSSTTNGNLEDYILGSIFTSPAYTVHAQSITAYIIVSNTHTVKAAIYTSSGTFIAGTQEVSVTTSNDGWVTFTFATPPSLTASTSYLLVVWSNSASGTAYLYYTSSGGTGRYVSQTYATN